MTKSERFILAYNKVAIALFIIKIVITVVTSVTFKSKLLTLFDAFSCIAMVVALMNTLGILKKEVLVEDDRIEYETSTPIMLIWLPRIVELFIIFIVLKNKQGIPHVSLIISCIVDLVLTAYSLYDRSKHVYIAKIERRDT